MTRKKLALIIGGAVAALLVVGGAVFVLTRSDSTKAAESEPTTSTTSTTAPLPVWPLTGVANAKASGPAHPAIVVKMDNSADARPQTGLNEADVVYELLVEGITRYALVFHSNLADPVGPVRSARSSDIDLVADLSTPLFVWSGANDGVIGEVNAAARKGILTDASYNATAPAYYRSNDREAPHNLYAHLPQVLQLKAPEKQGNPAPIFNFRKVVTAVATTTTSSSSSTTSKKSVSTTTTIAPTTTTTTLPGALTPGFTLDFGGVVVDYVWNPATKGWSRLQVDGSHPRAKSPTLDTAGVQVSPANVIVQFIDYGQSPSDSRSPMAITVGSGKVLIFTDGRVIAGTWSRPTADKPAVYTANDGTPILLTPGRTWVELPRIGSGLSVIDQATADAYLAIKG
ncbi:MAG: DUF3048 domain-containing protein [Actinobacteria bacterium]|nr:DUF3048 domain-containing protein [Actinomycetota bacterium]